MTTRTDTRRDRLTTDAQRRLFDKVAATDTRMLLTALTLLDKPGKLDVAEVIVYRYTVSELDARLTEEQTAELLNIIGDDKNDGLPTSLIYAHVMLGAEL